MLALAAHFSRPAMPACTTAGGQAKPATAFRCDSPLDTFGHNQQNNVEILSNSPFGWFNLPDSTLPNSPKLSAHDLGIKATIERLRCFT